MPPGRSLPPVPHPMRAELLLDARLPLDPDRIADAITARGLREKTDRRWEQTGDAFHRAMKGGEARIVVRSAPRELSSLAAQLDDASTGWDASPARRHTHVAEVTVGSRELSATLVSRVLVSIVAALLDLAGEGHVEVLAVSLGGRLLPAKIVQLSAMMHPAVSALAGLHRGRQGDGFLFRSSGLAELGLTDLEVIASDREPDEIVSMLNHWIYRLITEGGDVLRDGTTAGERGQRVEVRSARSSVGVGTVHRLSFAAEQMPDGVGEGRVKLTIESDDPSAIATLLANSDPAFETVIEASDYLREHYANGRVEVAMHRTLATLLYNDAERRFPGVRVRSDSALGVSRPGSGIFNSPTSDSAMQNAIAAARASIPTFVARLDAPQAGDVDFGVKFPFTEGKQTEHIWLSHVRRAGDKFIGVVSAVPQVVRKVARGTTVRVPVQKISDWAFTNGDTLHGQYTLRVMLPTLPPPMQRDFQARLAPLE